MGPGCSQCEHTAKECVPGAHKQCSSSSPWEGSQKLKPGCSQSEHTAKECVPGAHFFFEGSGSSQLHHYNKAIGQRRGPILPRVKQCHWSAQGTNGPVQQCPSSPWKGSSHICFLCTNVFSVGSSQSLPAATFLCYQIRLCQCWWPLAGFPHAKYKQ